MKNKSLTVSITIILAIMTITACTPASATPSSTLNVELSEFKFTPNTLVIFAGQETTLHLNNNGAVKHDLIILKQGTEAHIPFHAEDYKNDILLQVELDPGKSDTITFLFPEEGKYKVVCSIPGHMEAGMSADLKAVKP